jgi:hypothetical protein
VGASLGASERYAEDYNAADMAHTLRTSQTTFETFKEHQNGLGKGPCAPFEDEDEWQLAKFLVQEVSQTATDKFLKLSIVSGQMALIVVGSYKLTKPSTCHMRRQTKNRTQPSFSSNYTLLKRIDALPIDSVWKCKVIVVKGDDIGKDGKPKTESVELWSRDPIECLQNLIGNPAFRDHISYVSQKVFTSESGSTRIYDEAWTGDRWWAMQVSAHLPDYPKALLNIIDRNDCRWVLL